ncbi:MAG: PhzF family phenazine biosynthesis protein [Chitinophagaceae bacterium]
MKHISFYQVDAFTDTPFKGNPAAICLLEVVIPDDLMQKIAFENNLAETAFVLQTEDGFTLRWFTPTVEIKLCGHATLASAHILWEKGILPESTSARFFTESGLLTVTKKSEWIQLNFPRFSLSKVDVPKEIIDALGSNPINAVYSSDGRFILELANEKEVLSLKPDFSVLKNYETVVATSQSEPSSAYDFISRSFVPAHGVDEDPVTGSSHCALAPYWSEKLGKQNLFAYQASSRGGALNLLVEDDRVLIEGKAVTIIEGVLRLPL